MEHDLRRRSPRSLLLTLLCPNVLSLSLSLYGFFGNVTGKIYCYFVVSLVPLRFFESVFSYIFGDGDPNAGMDQRRVEAVAKVRMPTKGGRG